LVTGIGVGLGVDVGFGVEVGGKVEVGEGVLVAASAVSATNVAASSSGDEPQADNKIPQNSKTNPICKFLDINMKSLHPFTKQITLNV
jgi:serine acetyltransferase